MMKLAIPVMACGILLGVAYLSVEGQSQPSTNNSGGTKNSSGLQNSPRFDAARFLKDHDKNNDGKLSKDELPAGAQKDFAKIDTNNDGFLSEDELQKHATMMINEQPRLLEIVWYTIDVVDDPPTTDEVQETYDQLRQIDKNNDGKIDKSELTAFRDQRRKERIDNIFKELDKNNDGKISKDEARGLWIDSFADLDKNHDGMLDRQEIESACSLRHGDKSHQTTSKSEQSKSEQQKK